MLAELLADPLVDQARDVLDVDGVPVVRRDVAAPPLAIRRRAAVRLAVVAHKTVLVVIHALTATPFLPCACAIASSCASWRRPAAN